MALRDGLLAGFLWVVMLAGTFAAEHHTGVYRHADLGAVGLLTLIAVALAGRRRFPVPVLAAVSIVTLAYFVIGYPSGPVWFGLLLAYATATVQGHRLAAGAAAVGGFLAFPWLDALLGRGSGPTPLFLSLLAAGLLILFGLAEGLRVRRQRVAESERRRQEEVDRQANEERLRIARDLHDVLAHNISLISVQAGVALHVNPDLPDQARAALDAIKGASREALGELRSALDALRQTGDTAPREPAPGIGQLDELVRRATLAGLEAHLEVSGSPAPLPGAVELAAYRIAQEALTNVIRHAGATRVDVRLSYGAAGVTLSVIDNGRGGAIPDGGAGSGITGMRERAVALGGTLDAAPRPDLGFGVIAQLPAGSDAEGPL
jgi:signal transduction histidine kinase